MKKLVLISGGIGVLSQSCAKVLHENKFGILILDIKETESAENTIGEFFQCDISKEFQHG
jgi:uncharacterized UPF0146 family protein